MTLDLPLSNDVEDVSSDYNVGVKFIRFSLDSKNVY